jgi:hypothetical protein
MRNKVENKIMDLFNWKLAENEMKNKYALNENN